MSGGQWLAFLLPPTQYDHMPAAFPSLAGKFKRRQSNIHSSEATYLMIGQRRPTILPSGVILGGFKAVYRAICCIHLQPYIHASL